MTIAVTASRHPAVRAPFRVLAGLLCLTLVGVAVGMAYMTLKGGGVQALRVQDVIMFPGWLWIGRLMFLATLGRTEPPIDHAVRHDHWPFATARVASFYWLLIFVICLSSATYP